MSKNSHPQSFINLPARPVFAAGGKVDDDISLAVHQHERGQLIYMSRGIITCEVAQGLYLLAPGSSLWIPANVDHSIAGAGQIEAYCLYVGKKYSRRLPANCCTMTVSPLLKELIFKCTTLSGKEVLTNSELRLCKVLIDELAVAPLESMHLPMPSDPRLKVIADWIASKPAEKLRVEDWAHRIDLSERTLARLMHEQTGMSFGRWKQQLQISLALQWLAEGATVQKIADHLGYESASGFVAMFRKVMGHPPVKYMAMKVSPKSGATGEWPRGR
jgi:AraC-like DNA-binding protein